MERTKKCNHCGKDFIANDKRTSYCSKLCKNKARYQKAKSTKSYIKICKQCGKEFTTPNKNVELCSLECRGRYAAINGEEKRKLHRDTAKALEKRKATWESNGGHPMTRVECKQKFKNTIFNNHGVEYAMQKKELKNKQIESRNNTRIEKGFGEAICKHCGCNFTRNSTYQKYCSNCHKEAVYETRRDNICIDCGRQIMRGSERCCHCRAVYDYNNNQELRELLAKESEKHSESKINHKLGDLIEEIYGLEPSYEFHIGTQRYDLKVGNTLIEINPTWTHTSTLPENTSIITGMNPKDADYHFNKTKQARDNGYRIINIFDWDNKEKILYLIDDTKEKIYARDCECCIIQNSEGMKFFNDYHIQGSTKKNSSDIYVGLYYKGILIEVISFGIPRYNKNYQYEILRLCSHKNYYVIGGASKIFKTFIDKYNPKSIISYCDYGKFNGNVYEQLGFNILKKVKQSKHWRYHGVSRMEKERLEGILGYELKKPEDNKLHITDNYLRQRGFDQLLGDYFGVFGQGTSNEELMRMFGYLEVYDAGQATYVRHNPNKKESI